MGRGVDRTGTGYTDGAGAGAGVAGPAPAVAGITSKKASKDFKYGDGPSTPQR